MDYETKIDGVWFLLGYFSDIDIQRNLTKQFEPLIKSIYFKRGRTIPVRAFIQKEQKEIKKNIEAIEQNSRLSPGRLRAAKLDPDDPNESDKYYGEVLKSYIDQDYYIISLSFIEFIDGLLTKSTHELNKMFDQPESEKEMSIEEFKTIFKAEKDFEYFLRVLEQPRIAELFTIDENNKYHWKGDKNQLAGLAVWLRDAGKLINKSKKNQYLARHFCPFFHVVFDVNYEKSFSDDRFEISYLQGIS